MFFCSSVDVKTPSILLSISYGCENANLLSLLSCCSDQYFPPLLCLLLLCVCVCRFLFGAAVFLHQGSWLLVESCELQPEVDDRTKDEQLIQSD